MKILVTTLGKGVPTKDTPQNVHGNYRTATYRFDGCEPEAPTQFFGLALYRHLVSSGWTPDRIVVLGTPSSMWDAWLDSSDDLTEFSDLAGELYDLEKTDAAGVDAELLRRLSEVLSKCFGVEFDCRLVPPGKTETEQIGILYVLGGIVGFGDEIVLDVTHGFRHLPMIEMLSAFLLKHAKHPEVKGVYYGALEMTRSGQTPVIRLDGINILHDWIEAVAVLENSGNVLPLASVVSGLPDGGTAKKILEQYHFLYEVNALYPLRSTAGLLFKWVTDHTNEAGPLALFSDPLREAFAWHSLSPGKGQFELARRAFRVGRFTKSVLLLFEAVITAHLPKGVRPTDYAARNREEKNLSKSEDQTWWLLKDLRNALAHGTVSDKSSNKNVINGMRNDAERFRDEMEKLFIWAEPLFG